MRCTKPVRRAGLRRVRSGDGMNRQVCRAIWVMMSGGVRVQLPR